MGVMMIALLPPSSRSDRPRRRPTTSATRRPIRQLPVAEINGSRSILEHPLADVVGPADAELEDSFAAVLAVATSSTICWTATAVRGVRGEGFQIIVSPQTAAIMAFQAQTATGKLNAVMIPIGPSGCHCSIIRCRGRSLAIVSP